MNNNITNCIVVGLIAIVLVLFLYYNNPLLENIIKEGFYEETSTTSASDGGDTSTTSASDGGDTSTTSASDGGDTSTTPASGGGETSTTPANGGEETTTTSASGEEDNTTRVAKSLKREYVKSILALDKLDLGGIDAIKKKIKFTTRKVKDLDTDYIDIYDIEDDISSDGNSTKLDELETVSQNPNIKQFVKQIRLIGNEDGDFTQVDRNQDFFLNMINGVAIDINFVNNYVRDFNDTIETETLVEELLPNNFEGTPEDKKRYKDYSFNTCIVEISEIIDDVNENNSRDVVILTLEKEINIGNNNDDNTYNYLEVLNKDITDDKKKCKSIFAIQKCIIKIVLNENIKIDADTNFKSFVENINVPESSFSYELGFRYISMSGMEIIPVKGIYKVELYLNNVEYQTTSMNKWLQDKINTENKELLNEKLEKIITPMFDLDNEIDKRSKVVKRIHDIYRFNKLNNSRNTMRFYNSHY